MSNNSDFLLSKCTSGGCGAKIGVGELSDILSRIPTSKDANLLVGYDTSDDAAVYRINDQESIVSTLDFFSPMVDNAYLFGKIAATNALSDIYAMGATPLTALNIVCFPEGMDLKVLEDILRGGAEKVIEANAALAGGHSIYDTEIKYGLSVTGRVSNSRIIRNDTPKVGDKLILTKAIGVGVVMAALRAEMADDIALEAAYSSMQRLNKYAAEKMLQYNVTACTDITGFGLLVHASEMCKKNVSMKIYTESIPFIPKAYEYASEYLITAAGQRNRLHIEKLQSVTPLNNGDINSNLSNKHLSNKQLSDKQLGAIDKLPFAIQELLFDPQTSGGLLISVNSEDAVFLLNDIKKDDPVAEIVGEVIPVEEEIFVFA